MIFKDNHVYKCNNTMILILGAVMFPEYMQRYYDLADFDDNVNLNIDCYLVIYLNDINDLDKTVKEENCRLRQIKNVDDYTEIKVDKNRVEKYILIAKMVNTQLSYLMNDATESMSCITERVKTIMHP